MPKSKGKLIVFEGIDGAGKATQVKLLGNYFKKRALKFVSISFPQYEKSFFGKLVRCYLKGEYGGVKKVSAYLAAVLYAGDRFEAKNFIIENLNRGYFVICDRYVASNIAYQGVKLPQQEKKQFIKWIFELEYKIFQLPKENVTIFLNINTQTALKLRKKREKLLNQKADIHEKSLAYLKEVKFLFEKIAASHKDWITINCLYPNRQIKNPIEIHEEIIKALKKRNLII